jgi:hypothetical protein
MSITFTCQTCGSAVEYDLVAVETHALRQYGVHHYVCVRPCQRCAPHEAFSDSEEFKTADAA